MSYPISGQNPGYKHQGYEVDHKMYVFCFPPSKLIESHTKLTSIPHGVSVAVTSPSVFRFTAASNPERHLEAAAAFGVDVSQTPLSSAGEVLGEALEKFLQELGDQPKGLKDLGFGKEHLDELVEGTIPQRRVLMLAPGLEEEVGEQRETLRGLFEESM
jgi:hydroxyacid-oxoacid transhydrogenase